MPLYHKGILGRSFYSAATSCILFIAFIVDAATRSLVACVVLTTLRILAACVILVRILVACIVLITLRILVACAALVPFLLPALKDKIVRVAPRQVCWKPYSSVSQLFECMSLPQNYC